VRVAAVSVLVAALLPAASAYAAHAEILGNGFKVAPGSRLVGGTMFPVVSFHPPSDGPSGWTAVLEVLGPAATVYDAYATQARALGFEVAWSDQACGPDPAPGGIRCIASTEDGVTLDLRVCTTCEVPISAMRIVYVNVKAKRRAAIPGAASAANDPATDVQLDADERAAARAALPVPGQPLAALSHFRVGRGSRALINADIFGCRGGSNVAVLSSTGDAGKTFDYYVRHLPHEGPIETSASEVQGRRTRVAMSGWGTVSLVELPRGRALTMIAECYED
jgi:hypothetical protein